MARLLCLVPILGLIMLPVYFIFLKPPPPIPKMDLNEWWGPESMALSDSPAGLLAYILEKFSSGTRPENKYKPNGGLDKHFTKDQLIDNLMMYWIPRSITTSMRMYAETFNSKYRALKLNEIPTPVPTWVLQAKYEMAYQPPFMLKFKYTNLVDVTVVEDGGHFFALELPKVFAQDVLKAIGEFRKLKKDVKSEL